MTYNEFRKWCNERACDGKWSLRNSMTCMDIMQKFNAMSFFRRNRAWKGSDEQKFAETLAEYTILRIAELEGAG